MQVDELRAEIDSLGEKGFLKRYGKLYLVITDAELLEDIASFVITSTRVGSEIASKKRARRIDVRPIVGRPGQVSSRITVGRGDDCDIQINHPRVSKLQAYFAPHGGLLSLSDAGSKNGTRLNGVKLKPHQPAPVDVGDTLEIGPVAAALWGGRDVLAAIKG